MCVPISCAPSPARRSTSAVSSLVSTWVSRCTRFLAIFPSDSRGRTNSRGSVRRATNCWPRSLRPRRGVWPVAHRSGRQRARAAPASEPAVQPPRCGVPARYADRDVACCEPCRALRHRLLIHRVILGHALEIKPSARRPPGRGRSATSRNADRPLTTIRSSASMYPSAINWSTNAEWTSTAEPKSCTQNAGWACGSAQSYVTDLIGNHRADRCDRCPPAPRSARTGDPVSLSLGRVAPLSSGRDDRARCCVRQRVSTSDRVR